MSTQLVTGVTLGTTGSVSTAASVENVSQSFTPTAWESSTLPAPLIHSGQNGADLTLDLTSSYTTIGSAVFMNLSGAPLLLVGAGDFSAFGTLSIANAAQAIYPTGHESSVFGALTYLTRDSDSTPLTLDMTVTSSGYTAANVGMYFGTGIVATEFTVGDTSEFGATLVEGVVSFAPTPWQSSDFGSRTLVHTGQDGAAVLFNLVDTPDYTNPTRMDFTTSTRPVTGVGYDASSYGTASVANAAFAAYPESIEATGFGALTFVAYGPEPVLQMWLLRDPAVVDAAAVQMTLGRPFGDDKGVYLYDNGIGHPGATFIGQPTLTLTAQGLFASGFLNSSAVGSHTIDNNGQGIIAPGFTSSYVNVNATIADRAQTTHPVAIEPSSSLAPPTITHWVQYRAMQGFANTSFGAHSIINRDQYISVISAYNNIFGAPYLSRGLEISPNGWASSVVDTPEILSGTQYANVIGVPASGAGTPEAKNRNRIIYPVWFTSAGIGSDISIVNKNKQLLVGGYLDGETPGVVSKRANVENVVRVLNTSGHTSSRFGPGALVENAARGVATTSFQTDVFGVHRVEYTVRTVTITDGVYQFVSRYHTIYNDARVLAPSGIASTNVFGTAAPLNLNRTVRHHSGWVGPEMGTPMVAFAIRTVALYPTANPPYVPLPTFRHNPEYVSPASIWNEYQFGGAYLYIYRREVKPKSLNAQAQNWVSQPTVANRNRSVSMYGVDQATIGRPTVQLYTRYIQQVGHTDSVFGACIIKDRRLWVYPVGTTGWRVPVTHRVMNTIPDPPAPQRVYPGGPVSITFGTPVIQGNELSVSGIGSTAAFGAPSVRSNAIRPSTIYEEAEFGTPTLIFTRYLYPDSITPNSLPGAPSMSPWNIYAPGGEAAPPGYEPDNIYAHVMDYTVAPPGFGDTRNPWFGETAVTNQHRTVYALGASSAVRIGTPDVQLRKRYVSPRGTRFTRYGTPVIPFVPQTLNLDYEYNHQGIATTVEFGAHTVDFPAAPPLVNRTVYPVGLAATTFGTQTIELFNRQIYPVGTQMDVFGTPVMGWDRYYTATVGDMTSWGTARVEYLHRQLPVEGWDNSSFAELDFDDYYHHMNVRHKASGEGAYARYVQPTPVYPGAVGTPEEVAPPCPIC